MSGWIKYLRRVRVETDALKRNKDFSFYPNPSRDEGVRRFKFCHSDTLSRGIAVSADV
jgi:hypothetical protein